MLKVCLDCTARYLPGVPKCPQCFGMNWRPDYEEEDVPKITRAGGPSNAAAEAPGVEEAEAAAAAPEPEEEAPVPPPTSAPKAEHVEYATSALGVPPDEASAKTKAELIEQARAAKDAGPGDS